MTSEIGGPRVFPIAWHVDYWDYLNWVDPFSDPAYTDRQERVAVALGQSNLYTPEMVIQMTEMSYSVTTSVSQTTEYIDYFIEQPVDVSVTVWLESEADGSPIVVNYMIDGAPQGSELTVVLVEGGLVSNVTGGENSGATLEHENVVRAFATVTEELESGQVELTPPEDLAISNARIIAFVQDSGTLDYFGATGISLDD